MDASSLFPLEQAAARLHDASKGARSALLSRPPRNEPAAAEASAAALRSLEAHVDRALEGVPSLRAVGGGGPRLGALLPACEAAADEVDAAIEALSAHYLSAGKAMRRRGDEEAVEAAAAMECGGEEESGAAFDKENAPCPSRSPVPAATKSAAGEDAGREPSTPVRASPSTSRAVSTPARTPSLADFGLSAYFGGAAPPVAAAASPAPTPAEDEQRPPAASAASPAPPAEDEQRPVEQQLSFGIELDDEEATDGHGPIQDVTEESMAQLPGYITKRMDVAAVNGFIANLNRWIRAARPSSPRDHTFTTDDIARHSEAGNKANALTFLMLKAQPPLISTNSTQAGVRYWAYRPAHQ